MPYSELTNAQKLSNLMAHALLGGVVAELSGGSAAAGATGAVTGELAAPAIALVLYGTADSDKLSPDEKANLNVLAGKNAVENNAPGDGWNNILTSEGMDYGKPVSSWNQYVLDNDLSPGKNQDGLKKLLLEKGRL